MESTTQVLIEKWGKVLDSEHAPAIRTDRKAVVAQMLENQKADLSSQRVMLGEAAPTNSVANAGVANWDPILISLVRRAMPNLLAFDMGGVQPMSGPTGLIFAMKSRYNSMSGTEALFNEADTDFSGAGIHGGDTSSLIGSAGSNDAGTTASTLIGAGTGDNVADDFSFGYGMTTAAAEDDNYNEMGFSIEKTSVEARSRQLKAQYSLELYQDLKAIHGLDADAELANILAPEILAEINREFIRTIVSRAKLGAQTENITTAGYFDLQQDADGRWSAEKIKGMVLQLELEANQIAKDTRRGKGNFTLCSSNVAAALRMAGVLDYAPLMKTDGLKVDDTGNTFAGTINGWLKVYIDPYAVEDYCLVGYRGSHAYDAGIFYCPYVPLTQLRATDPGNMAQIMAFKTRYGMVANPFAEDTPQSGIGNLRANKYFRIFGVKGILG
jgi:hypothetical protein